MEVQLSLPVIYSILNTFQYDQNTCVIYSDVSIIFFLIRYNIFMQVFNPVKIMFDCLVCIDNYAYLYVIIRKGNYSLKYLYNTCNNGRRRFKRNCTVKRFRDTVLQRPVLCGKFEVSRGKECGYIHHTNNSSLSFFIRTFMFL